MTETKESEEWSRGKSQDFSLYIFVFSIEIKERGNQMIMASEAGVAAHVTVPLMESGANEVEYESDTEVSLALAMRRRGASDDEEEDEEERIAQGFVGHESEDDEGAPPLEDEEEDEDEEEEEAAVMVAEEVEEEEYEEEEENDEIVDLNVLGIRQPRHQGGVIAAAEGAGGENGVSKGADQEIGSPRNDKDQAEEEKKEAEPFAVPTAGAFYMHDDRFRDNGGARPRRSSGGRKLWEAKDDRAWVHDRFEELNLQDDMGYEEGRRRGGRGRFRGRGRGRDGGRGQGRGNRSRIFEDNNGSSFARRGGGRGRGSRRKDAELRNAGDGFMGMNKQFSKAADDMLKNSSSKKPSQPGGGQLNGGIPKKHPGSSLSSASPPFYPSGTQHQSMVVPVKSEPQHAGTIGSLHNSVVKGEDEMGTSIASTSSRNGKNIVAVREQAQSHVEPALRSCAEKQPITMQQISRSSSIHLPQQQKSKVQGRNSAAGGQLINQPTNSGHQLNRGSNFTQSEHMVQQRPLQTHGQGGLRMSSQQLVQQTSSNNQSSSRPATSEGGNAASPPGSNKGKSVAVGRGRGSPQGAGRSTYPYNGTQAIAGTSGMSVAHSEQSFPPAPALLPLMQFGGQHHAGLGVPAVGMALPGYVAQPQLGFGGSEMTWVPFLAGAAGALGATYCSPYIAVDGGYYAQPTTQPAAFGVAGRDSSGNKPQNMWKSTPRSELVNDEFGQRQNKPRRYSEMNFGQ